MTRKQLDCPVTTTLKATGEFVDNAMSLSLERINFGGILSHLKFDKTQGASPFEILYLILISPIVKSQSTWAFCSQFLEQWSVGEKDVIYRFLLRQDIKWADLQIKVSSALANLHLGKVPIEDCALVVDCSLKHRSGKVEGASHLFDHVVSKVVRAQKVVTLGLAFPKGFIPLANQFCIGKKKRQNREVSFEDNRSEVAKAYQRGVDETPNNILKSMVKRVMRTSLKIKWLIGDSGYCQKCNIILALDNGLDALFLMRRDNTTYRVAGKLYNAKELYKLFRRKMQPAGGGRFRSYAFKAELNLNKKGETPRWIDVQLMLSRPTRNRNKNGWVLSLCTDMEVSVDRMIELYLMRWSIEVFFKECKQNLGWLNNQSGNFVSSYASIHLSSLRYLILLDAALQSQEGERGLVAIRREMSDHFSQLCYMGMLWEWFTRLIFGWLDEMENLLDQETLGKIKTHLIVKIDEFIDLAFQIDFNSEDSPEPA